MSQGPPNPGFMQEKVQKRRFSKKAIARIENFLLFYVPMILLEGLDTKLEAASFFAV